jgi:hypothetical protein
LRSGRISGLTPALEKSILAQAKFNEELKREIEHRDGQVALTSKIARAQLDSVEAITKSNQALKEEIDLIGLDNIGVLGVEKARTSSTRALKEETRAKKEAQGIDDTRLQALDAEIAALREREELLGKKIERSLEERYMDSAKSSGEAIKDTLGDSIADGILDGFRRGESFTDIFIRELKAQFAKTILRPLIQPVADAGNKAIGDIIGAISVAIGGSGSGFMATNTTGTSLPTAGGADSGTNFVERDMLTILHKGEAVIPKAYNPAANPDFSGGPRVTIINNTPATVTPRRGANGELQFVIEQAAKAAHGMLAADHASGSGPSSRALKSRGLNLDRGIPTRA